ncbi:AMP-binding protein [Kitasatospora sp. NPDC050543]|uniref:AMP-binding protein n=1 Tax=Kitasatospora sp. NPDC050543 TaxID=3364054 RepID=UPI00379D3E7B
MKKYPSERPTAERGGPTRPVSPARPARHLAIAMAPSGPPRAAVAAGGDRPPAGAGRSPRRSPARWFAHGRHNVSYLCVDRHVEAGHGERVAIHFEGAPGDSRAITYSQLKDEVCRAANALRELGVGTGDRVVIHLPALAETVIAMLACARIGAVHLLIRTAAGAHPDELAGARLVITADGSHHDGGAGPFGASVADVLAACTRAEHVLVVRRTGRPLAPSDERALWWHEVIARQPGRLAPEPYDARHPLFTLAPGGPRGSGEFLTRAGCLHRAVFDLRPQSDVYWCTADLASESGHSFVGYGPLANGATQVIYEGAPDTPPQDRFWQVIKKHRVSVLHTASDAIRSYLRWSEEAAGGFDRSGLRVLAAIEERPGPQMWIWRREHVGPTAGWELRAYPTGWPASALG